MVKRLRVIQSEFAKASRKGRARHVQDAIEALEGESITEALTRGMQQTRLNLERVMKRLFPLLCVLAFSAPCLARGLTVTDAGVMWDASPPAERQILDANGVQIGVDLVPIAGYEVVRGAVCGTWTVTVDVGNVTTYTIPLDLSRTTAWCFAVRSYVATGEHSPDSETAILDADVVQPPTVDPRCVAPLGDRAPSIFITTWSATNGAGGSLARVNMQLGSPNSPITSVHVLVNDLVNRSMIGTDLTALGGIWFQYPTAPGTYTISMKVINQYGCSTIKTKNAAGQAMTFIVP